MELKLGHHKDKTLKEELKLMQNLVSFDSEISEENLLYLKDCLADAKYEYYKTEIKNLIAGYQGLLNKWNKAIQNSKNETA
jgi:hypothetical protein